MTEGRESHRRDLETDLFAIARRSETIVNKLLENKHPYAKKIDDGNKMAAFFFDNGIDLTIGILDHDPKGIDLKPPIY